MRTHIRRNTPDPVHNYQTHVSLAPVVPTKIRRTTGRIRTGSGSKRPRDTIDEDIVHDPGFIQGLGKYLLLLSPFGTTSSPAVHNSELTPQRPIRNEQQAPLSIRSRATIPHTHTNTQQIRIEGELMPGIAAVSSNT